MRSPTSSPRPERNRKSHGRAQPAAGREEVPRRSRPGGVPPSGAPMTGVLGELAFYYGACWLHYRSSAAQRPEK
jgi:hypothetical protein